jgi:hypothetical protein
MSHRLWTPFARSRCTEARRFAGSDSWADRPMDAWPWSSSLAANRASVTQSLLLDDRVLFSALAIDLEGEGANELLDQVGMHQMLLEGIENERLQYLARQAAAVRAGAHLAGCGAGEIIATDRGEGAATRPVADETRQQVPRPAAFPKGAGPAFYTRGEWAQASSRAATSCQIPSFDDAQLGDVLDDPGRWRIDACRRRPVTGSLMKRWRFQTRRPM